MSRSAIDRLHDIVLSAQLVRRHAEGLDAKAFGSNEERRDAALFRLAILCEAATHLPADIQAIASEIPWADIRGMRNYIIHSYWQIDFGVVLDTIRNDLEPLMAASTRLISILEHAEQ